MSCMGGTGHGQAWHLAFRVDSRFTQNSRSRQSLESSLLCEMLTGMFGLGSATAPLSASIGVCHRLPLTPPGWAHVCQTAAMGDTWRRTTDSRQQRAQIGCRTPAIRISLGACNACNRMWDMHMLRRRAWPPNRPDFMVEGAHTTRPTRPTPDATDTASALLSKCAQYGNFFPCHPQKATEKRGDSATGSCRAR